jgi:Zinc carboxypeptidase
MARRFGRALLLLLVVFALAPVSSANADIAPPWCGTPENDSAENLPDGTDPADPPGSFPHIPYYAIGCTLRDIERRSDGRMDVDVIGRSALGRPMYSVVINELDRRSQREDYRNWQDVRELALRDPRGAQRRLDRFGDDVKVPVYIQGAIHGNEYEGVDAAMILIEKIATTRRGVDPFVDDVLDHTILVFNVIQNPDGRVAGTRANGNGFDLNRDYLTQSQSETRASVELMKEWLAPELLDLHGYVSPTLIEATTKPHNPSIEYDLWLKWNQPRIDANEAALLAGGWDTTRPINEWCPEAEPANSNGLCDDGSVPGPDVAEGWDDWGPFYTAMYAQHVGLDSSTVEMCDPDMELNDEGEWEAFDPQCGGREGSRNTQTIVQESTLEYVIDNREEMLFDMLEVYLRGDRDAPRPACCEEPFDPEFHNWMLDYPKAYVIPVGDGQRSDAEANRLVEWLLFNDIEVTELERDLRFGGQTFEEGSYVVWLAQPRRGLLDTALSIGVDISPRIQRLYAPPAAWSHGYLWGADVVTIPDGASFSARTDRISRPNRLRGGLEDGRADGYTLEIDSPTAVRALNALVGDGVDAGLALEPFSGGAAGTAVFGDDRSTTRKLDDVGEDFGLVFRRLRGAAPAVDPITAVPRFRVITGANGTAVTDQSTWVLRELGFVADPITIQQINNSATDPLGGYDVIFNATTSWPTPQGNPNNDRPVARQRLTAFFAGGGGYIGGQANGANFLRLGNQAVGLTVTNNSGGGDGYSGIMYWDNVGGASSVITGVYPARDTLIADPPTWLTGVPTSFMVDGRLPGSGFFAAGLFPGAATSSAAGAAVIAHGPNATNTARLAVFANNPLYRADPEREWPMVGAAAYWADLG